VVVRFIAYMLLLLAGACGGRSSSLQTLEKLYQRDFERAKGRTSTIIFVPGIMGSELHDTRDGHVVWGTFWNGGAWEDTLRDFALPFAVDQPVGEIRDSIEPGGELLVVHLDVAGREIAARGYPGLFEGLIQSLAEHGAHHTPDAIGIEDLEAGRDPIIGFGYDWRRDIASEAQRLHELVEVASQERFRRTGNPRVDIVAHSMGTLLVRWYLQYGTSPVPEDGSLPELTWAGVEYVERVLLVGAPNLGEASVLEILHHGAQAHHMLPTYPPAVVATFPSGFELLPRPWDRRVVWSDDGEPVDLYDVALWEKLRWGPFREDQDEALQTLMPQAKTRSERLAIMRKHMAAMLAHAHGFHRALDRPAHPPEGLRIHAFVGDAHGTRAVLSVDRATGEMEWIRTEPGDGTTTRTSALGQPSSDPKASPTLIADSVHFIEAEHLPMVGDRRFLDQAMYLLLEAPDPPARESREP
jgi:hypothetical protein